MSARIWFLAARPKTLPAAVIPVLLGSTLAYHDGTFVPLAALICLVFALLIQIGTNYANDYFDWERGADTPERQGPTRFTAAQIVLPERMLLATKVAFGAALLVGIGLTHYGGWWLVFVGVGCVISGLAYTAGPLPLAYNALGELFVFLFFGLLAVAFTYYVQTGRVSLDALLIGAYVGGLATNLIIVNNVRDILGDTQARKRTLAVAAGREFCEGLYLAGVLLVPIVAGLLAWRVESAWLLGPVVLLPRGLMHHRRLSRALHAPAYRKLLAATALYIVQAGSMLAAGLVGERVFPFENLLPR